MLRLRPYVTLMKFYHHPVPRDVIISRDFDTDEQVIRWMWSRVLLEGNLHEYWRQERRGKTLVISWTLNIRLSNTAFIAPSTDTANEHIDGSWLDCSKSSALAMQLLQCSTKPRYKTRVKYWTVKKQIITIRILLHVFWRPTIRQLWDEETIWLIDHLY